MSIDPSPALELHACMTPNVLKVMFMLGELDLPFRLHHVRIFAGEQFAEGFERLHPYRKLPVLIDRDGPDGRPHTIFESGAILLYLAEKTDQLAGEGAAERSRVLQWLMLQMSSVGPAFGSATHFNRAAPAGEAYGLQRFRTQAARLCEVYDGRLGEARYLAGAHFTLADIATFPWLWRHPAMIGLDAAAYPNIQRWVAEIASRPGLKRIHGQYRALVDADRADAAAASPVAIDRLMGRGRWTLPSIAADVPDAEAAGIR